MQWERIADCGRGFIVESIVSSAHWVRDLVFRGYRGVIGCFYSIAEWIIVATEQQLMLVALFLIFIVILFSIYMITRTFIRLHFRYVDVRAPGPVRNRFVRGQNSDFHLSPNYTHLHHPYNYRYRASRRPPTYVEPNIPFAYNQGAPVAFSTPFDELTNVVNSIFHHNRETGGNDASSTETRRMSEMDRNRIIVTELHQRVSTRRRRLRSSVTANPFPYPPFTYPTNGHENDRQLPEFPNPGTSDE